MEALTNNQLKMYLRQHGLKISGSKADLTKRVLSHARENAAKDVLEDDEFYNLCEDDTTSESESSDSDEENSYVEESFEVLSFVAEEDIQHVNKAWGSQCREKAGNGGRGVNLNIISRWGEVKVNFRLVRGGLRLNFERYFSHFPTLPPPDNYCTVPKNHL